MTTPTTTAGGRENKIRKINEDNINSIQKKDIYSTVKTFFYCTRCHKKFWALAIIEKSLVPHLSDSEVFYTQTDNEFYLFCHRCTRAFYTFLRIKK